MRNDTVPALSIVIPHYNAPNLLHTCLGSLASQTLGTELLEVIVVDNDSAKRPDAAVADFAFARLAEEPTPGPGPARNCGARLASAPILAFIDCDCRAAPQWAEKILATFDANPGLGVIGGDVRIAFANPDQPTSIEAYEAVFGYRMQLYVERDRYTASCNMAVRTPVFREVGDFGGIDIAEDVEWGRRASRIGISMRYVPEMQVETLARPTFAELIRKWDRHLSHDATSLHGPAARARWIARSGLMAFSPFHGALMILRSDRIHGVDARLAALGVMARIRLYRARRMLTDALTPGARGAADRWRRQ